MGNSLTKAGGSAVAAADVANPFAAAGAGAGNTTFVKFKGASGDFLYGQDDEELERPQTFAADIENSQWVWSFWWEGSVLDTRETLVASNPRGYEQEPDDLPEDYDGDMSLEEIRAEQADRKSNFMDGWTCQAVLGLREIGGEGEEYTLKLNQGVALNAFRSLLNSFGRQYKFKPGLVPLVELDAKSYVSKNKAVGKRYAPVLKIVDWKSEEDLMLEAGEDPNMYDDPADQDDTPDEPEAKELPAPEKEEEPEKEAPRSRRGRGRGRQNYA